MPTHTELDSPLLRLRLTPPYAVAEIAAGLEEAVGVVTPGQRPDLLIVVEGSQNTPAAEIRQIVNLLEGLRERIGPHVGVAAGSDLSYGLFRMFGVYAGASGFEVAVFRRLGEARRWLLHHLSSSTGAT